MCTYVYNPFVGFQDVVGVDISRATIGVRIDLVGVRIVYNSTSGCNETVEVPAKESQTADGGISNSFLIAFFALP